MRVHSGILQSDCECVCWSVGVVVYANGSAAEHRRNADLNLRVS